MRERNDLAVLIPTYNEAEGIGPTIQEIRDFLQDTPCVVVDRSSDETSLVAAKFGAKVVRQEGKGKGRAIIQGIHELNGGARYIAMTDGDHTYPAEAIRKFVSVLEQNPDVGMVNGNRFASALPSEIQPKGIYLGNKLIAVIHNFLNPQKLADPLTGLRVFRAELLKDWNPSSKGFDIEVEMNLYLATKNQRIEEVPITYRARIGRKKLGLRSAFPIIFRIAKIRLRGTIKRRFHL